MRLGLLIGTVFLTSVPHGWAQGRRVVYVDNRAGDDRAGGSSSVNGTNEQGPNGSIQTALRRVVPSGMILLLPSGYPIREEVVIDGRAVRGYPWRPLVIEGNGQEWSGTAPTPLPASIKPPVDISWLQAPITLSERLEDGVPFGSLVTSLIPMPTPFLAGSMLPFTTKCGSTNSTTSNTTLGGWYPAIGWNERAAQTSPFAFDRELREYVLSTHRLRYALVIHRASHVLVRNVRFIGFSLDAVQVRGPVEGVVFENCSFDGCGRYGLTALTNAHVELRNCSFENNGKAAVLNGNFSDIRTASCKMQSKPLGFDQDANSKNTLLGGEFKPFEKGPFNVPQEFLGRHPELAGQTIPGSSTGAPKAPAPKAKAKPAADDGKPKPKKSFFDE